MIKKHLETDKKSHIFVHFLNDKYCNALRTFFFFFENIDSVSTQFRLKLKEAMHII